MADATAAPAVAPAKSPKKKAAAKPKKPSAHPKYSEMIGKAIAALKERGGSSRQAILKYIMANFNVGKDAKSVNAHLKLALRAGVKNNSLKQSKGTGASGSFRIGEAKVVKKKPAKAKKAAKPKAAKPKKAKTTPKKKKPAAKKPAGEKKAAKPKAKKPAAKKAAKPKKPAAKSPAKKKAAKPKPRRHQRRSKLFQTSVCRGYSATKSPFKGYPIYSKRIYNCCTLVIKLNLAEPYFL
ncbi:histone H1-delta-like [Mytilus trossulus]|uniref:histone H1-delta-like n=1 Tax=Mytilus trossulus TaxID=6551 RepID=UPI0030051A28